jgi:hypothetical protein
VFWVARKWRGVGEFVKHDLRIIWDKTTCFLSNADGMRGIGISGNSITCKAIDSFMAIVNPSLPQAAYPLPKTGDIHFYAES